MLSERKYPKINQNRSSTVFSIAISVGQSVFMLHNKGYRWNFNFFRNLNNFSGVLQPHGYESTKVLFLCLCSRLVVIQPLCQWQGSRTATQCKKQTRKESENFVRNVRLDRSIKDRNQWRIERSVFVYRSGPWDIIWFHLISLYCCFFLFTFCCFNKESLKCNTLTERDAFSWRS